MVEKFEHLLLVSHFMSILQAEGMKDKTLAEYLISICKTPDMSVDKFRQHLGECGASVSAQASAQMFTVVTGDSPVVDQNSTKKVVYLDEQEPEACPDDEEQKREQAQELETKFPGLSLPN